MFDSAAPRFTVFADDQSDAASRSVAMSRASTRAERAVPTPGRRSNGHISDAEFKRLYDKHFRLVWHALTRLGVRDVDRMDLAQKVFFTAYLKLPGFQGRSQLSTWLWGICRRVAVAYRRSGAIRYEVTTDPLNLPVREDPPSGLAHEADTTRQVEAEGLLSKLSEPLRLVFKLFEVDGLRGPEIAARLKISLAAVRSRLHRARKLLQREMRRLDLARAS